MTCAAVNCRKTGRDGVYEAMRRRIFNIIRVIKEGGYKNVILGAFGCGVFRNDPAEVSLIFKEAL